MSKRLLDDDVNTWPPEQRAQFCSIWKVLVEQNNGHAPKGITDGELDIAYQLNLLPRPTAVVEVQIGNDIYRGVVTLVAKEEEK